jgi:1-deoxy-D-xylulose-5-phosphate synthase
MRLLSKIDNPSDIKKLSQRDLPILAEEVRQYILKVVSKNGGHLGAALGAVDLAIALHYCFETPKDTIVWDVGHQVHAHKILTGRREAFTTFRQGGGLSGFSNKDESIHDPFTTGHGGTSISSALGIAVANRLASGAKAGQVPVEGAKRAIAVIGDASLVSGMALEALNHAGHLNENLIVILNDNEMSISKTVGALSKYLNKIISNPVYNHLRKDVESLLRRIPRVGRQMVSKAKKLDEGFKHLFIPGQIFEEMGFRYFGPLDGHSIPQMIQILRNISKIEGPILLHVITKKGKGYKVAESDPARWHSSTPFCVETGQLNAVSKSRTYTKVFGETVVKLAGAHSDVAAITAAMCDGTGLVEYAQKFPERFFDVGIAEEHGVTFAAGLVKAGFRPYVAIYSTFLQRAHDQIIHDVALQGLPVIFCLDRAGLVGEDGPTHHGVFDIAYLRKIPGLALLAPRDGRELEMMIRYAYGHRSGPLAIRFPRGAVHEESGSTLKDVIPPSIGLGRSELLREGEDVLLVAIGSMVYEAYEAAELLAKKGVETTVLNARFVKPLDEASILRHARDKKLILTLEEGSLAGGFGSAVLELFEKQKGVWPPIKISGIPDRFIEHGKRETLLDSLGLTAPKIEARVLQYLQDVKETSPGMRNGKFEAYSAGAIVE